VSRIAVYDKVLDDEAIAQHAAAPGDISPSVTTGEELRWWLTEVGWPTGANFRDIDTGAVTLAMRDTSSGSLLVLAQQLADTEDGYLYIAPGGQITFRDRTSRDDHSANPHAYFGPGQLDNMPEPFRLVYDDTFLFNQIRVAGYDHSAVEVNDATSQAAYGTRTLSRNYEWAAYSTRGPYSIYSKRGYGTSVYSKRAVAVSSGTILDAIAAALLSRYKDPHLRFDAFAIHPGTSAELWSAIITLDIGDRINMTLDPPGTGADIDIDCFIEGIQFELGTDLVVTYATSPAVASGY
jgi:hypothetical protein